LVLLPVLMSIVPIRLLFLTVLVVSIVCCLRLKKFPQENGSLVKVQCTLVQALRLCTGRTVHRGSRGIALLFHDHGTRRRWGVSVTPRPLFTTGKDLVPIVQKAGWAPGPVWTGAENLAPPHRDSILGPPSP
jgi:hypothetical protein